MSDNLNSSTNYRRYLTAFREKIKATFQIKSIYLIIRLIFFSKIFTFCQFDGLGLINGGKICGRSYLRESSGLFLNAAAIITETCCKIDCVGLFNGGRIGSLEAAI